MTTRHIDNDTASGMRERARPLAEAVAKVRPESGVLLVEDDPDTQWRLARMLAVHGARVVGTSSGEAALAVIEQWPADIVLVDQSLPGMDGLEVARQIRRKFPSIPVVLMTTEESADLRIAAKVAGAVETLIKPFRFEALAHLMQSILSHEIAVEAAKLVDGLKEELEVDLAPAE